MTAYENAVKAYQAYPTLEAEQAIFAVSNAEIPRYAYQLSDDIASIAISPDGRRFAVGGGFGLKSWDMSTGTEVFAAPRGSSGCCNDSLDYSPDGKQLLSITDRTVHVYDALTGIEQAGFSAKPNQAWAAKFSPAGDRIAVVGGDASCVVCPPSRVTILDAQTGVALGSLCCHNSFAFGLDFVSDGRLVTVGDDGRVILWDLSTGREVNEWVGYSTIDANAGGTRLLSSFADLKDILDLSNGRTYELVDGNRHALKATFSPDGTWIGAVVPGGINIYDEDGYRLRHIAVQRFQNAQIVIAPSGDQLIMADMYGEVLVLNVNIDHAPLLIKAYPIQPPNTPSSNLDQFPFRRIGFGSDPSYFMASGRETQGELGAYEGRAWNLDSGQALDLVKDTRSSLWPIVSNVDSRYAMVLNPSAGIAQVWDLGSSQLVATLDKAPRSVTGAIVSPDGSKALAFFIYAYDTQFWNMRARSDSLTGLLPLANGQKVLTSAGSPQVAVFTSDSQRLFMGYDNTSGTVIEYDANTLETLAKINTGMGYMNRLVLSPDGTRFSVSGHDSFDPIIIDPVQKLSIGALHGHTGKITDLVYSPDGNLIATSSEDHTARIWQANTGKQIMVLDGHTASVNDVDFSPDGSRIVTAGKDGTTRLWDVATGQLITVFDEDCTIVYAATFTPDGKQVVTSCGDRFHVWMVDTLEVLQMLIERGRRVGIDLGN